MIFNNRSLNLSVGFNLKNKAHTQAMVSKTAKIFSVFILFVFCLFVTISVSAQIIKPKIKKTVVNESETPAEKSVAVDAKVNISLCVTKGKVKVHGWDRNEIRAFVSSGGSQVGFKILQKSKQTDKPVWVMILGFDPSQSVDREADECLSGDEIELDVPRGATVNIKSRESETMIESVGKVRVENIGGDIFLKDIAQGIEAATYQGDVTVSRSSGAMNVSSASGNIVAFDLSPSEIGDVFKAKTINGAITLQEIEHRQIEVSSNSGSIKFTGDFLNGGQYNFGTANGAIMLALSEKSSCKITAFFGFGQFASEIPLKDKQQSPASGAQNLTAQIGNGEATLNLKTFSGSIIIRKQSEK
ncbi:hypothetical protein BH10ACI1_BH10ACI1_28410 [soil metagenome]